MGISLSDLSAKAREQVVAKLAIEQVKKIKQAEKPSKYHAEKVESRLADGTPHTFDSVKEAKRYSELAILLRAGEITDLRVQVPFELIPKQKKADGKEERPCSYVADFVYKDNHGNEIVEDTKGIRTKEYIIKRKIMLWRYGITIKEV